MTDDPPLPARLPGGPFRPKVRDVADFLLRWGEFRPVAGRLTSRSSLSEEEADTLGWMIELIDRISPQDLENGGG